MAADMTGHNGRPLQMVLCPPETAIVRAGSVLRPCAYCGRALWVEPEIIECTEVGEVLPMCAGCVALELGVNSRGVRLGVLPGQEEAFAQMGISVSPGDDVARFRAGSESYQLLLEAIDELRRDDEKREEP